MRWLLRRDRWTGTVARHKLVGLSDEALAAYAVRYAGSMSLVASGAPQVILTKKVTAAKLPVLFETAGLKSVFFRCGEPPLVLTVQQGHFRVGARAPAVGAGRSNHLALVFGMNEGDPALRMFGREAEAAAKIAAQSGV
jgi:hypothetical protein